MAPSAGLVSERRGRRFSLVTPLTRLCYGATVRLVTTDALLVAGVHLAMRCGMTVRACRRASERMMR